MVEFAIPILPNTNAISVFLSLCFMPFLMATCFREANWVHALSTHTYIKDGARSTSVVSFFILSVPRLSPQVFSIMHYSSYLFLFCSVLVFSHALSLPQATARPQKRVAANSTVLGNSTAKGHSFALRLDPGGGTVTMDVGPLSLFTTVSKQDPVPVLPNMQ